ncbi:hypothetical protein AAG906_019618 [Vitis piasezkii]
MYSWGSAVLAHLYRELCRASLDGATDIAGCVTLLQLWSWERLHLGRPDFGRPPAPPAAQHLEHDAVDDLPAEHLEQGLQDEALLHEGLLADPLGCRWRVPLSWAQNPSRVLTFYRDQLDAQTHDQVHIRSNVLLLSCPSSGDISSRPGDLEDDVTSYLL